tara:strand:- start:1018 stop:1857 length:840 start_codon:yes stop_codon:yes gene_type:complete
MPRNNQDRLTGKKKPEDEGSPPQSINPLLQFVTPTEFVELPTKGKFYPKDHPLHGVDTVEIKYMTAKETDLLTSKTLLKKGIAVDRMLQSILVDQSIKVKNLFVGDKNALMMAARVSGFGNLYNGSVTCRNCGGVTEETFDLSEVNVREAPEDAEYKDEGTFVISLPQTQVTAECRLLTGDDEQKLASRTEKKKKLNLPETGLTDQLKEVIVSVNDITERSMVEEFVDVMPALDANHLRNEYDKMRPDVDLSYTFECSACEAENNVSIPFSTNFFWPDR